MRRPRRQPLCVPDETRDNGLIMVPLVLPEIVVGVSLLVVILQFGFELSLWSSFSDMC